MTVFKLVLAFLFVCHFTSATIQASTADYYQRYTYRADSACQSKSILSATFKMLNECIPSEQNGSEMYSCTANHEIQITQYSDMNCKIAISKNQYSIYMCKDDSSEICGKILHTNLPKMVWDIQSKTSNCFNSVALVKRGVAVERCISTSHRFSSYSYSCNSTNYWQYDYSDGVCSENDGIGMFGKLNQCKDGSTTRCY